ncbi:NACHT, LRR and PYD domains-containing protein 7-like isoform X2 [Centruroides vittatus]|uniref:NACHT, LRR and PYD domains-containing protein 7-like isoform X2 n=2 Tax=Centruroides vittatus TaxID=120091 RepID=UPI00350EAE31
MGEGGVSSEEKSLVVYPVNYKQVANVTYGMMQNENILKELLKVENCNQSPTMLKNCTQVHLGPKIEIHSEESKRSLLKKEDEERSEMLKSYRQMLKNKYMTYFSYMRSFLWEGKRNDFPLKDYFVELTVNKADLFGKKSGEKVSLNEIFSIEYGHQTILVTGDPGYGKSTLCKKIVYDWATTNYLKHFDLTFIVILRELSNKSVKDALFDDMREFSLTNMNWNLQDMRLNILVILDGFDEIVEKSKIIRFIRKESFCISHRMTIVVTSRPQAAEDIREDMNMRFSIEGFSLQYQKKYIKSIFREDDKKANELFSKLNEHDFYAKIAECPLMLHMLCCLHQSGETEKLETITDLYIRIFSLITERYVRKTNQQDKFKRGKYFVGENLLVKFGEIHDSISSEHLRKSFPKEDEYNFIMGLDILTLDSISQCDNTIRYSFVHLTFGEFLSSLFMYIGIVSFPGNIGETELLFLLGFYKDKPLPKNILEDIEGKMFSPKFLLRARKEIKLKTNWEQFCSNAKVILRYWNCFAYLRRLLKWYEFKTLYFHFSETFAFTWNELDETEYDDLFYLINYTLSNNTKMYLLLTLKSTFTGNVYDIRETFSHMIDFINVIITNNLDIFLIGLIFPMQTEIHRFTNVILNLDLSDDQLKLLKVSEDEKLVALEVEVFRGISDRYVISLEQYKTLRDHILFKSASKQNSKCVIM